MYKKCEEILNKLQSEGKIKISDYQFPQKQELKLKLKDMLEDEVDEKYYLSEDIVKKITNTKHKKFTNNNLQIEPIDYRYDEGLRNRVDKEIIPILTCKVGASGFSGQPLLKIKEATKKGYKEAYEGDSINLAYPESETRRGRVGEQVAQTLQCNDNMGVVEYSDYSKKKIEQNLKSINNELSGTLTANCMQSINHDNCQMTFDNNLRIRKLSSLEVWRLMGFDKTDFEKAAKVNSNTQLYKQAGNSIVVNVLEAILTNLLK